MCKLNERPFLVCCITLGSKSHIGVHQGASGYIRVHQGALDLTKDYEIFPFDVCYYKLV